VIHDDGVELVAVHDEESSAIGGGVRRSFSDFDVPKVVSDEGPEEIVVVSGDEDDLGLPAGTLQELVNDFVVEARPHPALPERFDVDDITYQIQVVTLD
jgi:hypothetical protein